MNNMKVDIGSIELGPMKAIFLKVVAKVNGDSLRRRVAAVLDGHLARFAAIYSREVTFVARVYNISWNEAFALLSSERPSPFRIPYTSEDLVWAKEQPFLVREEDIGRGGGLGLSVDPTQFADLYPGVLPADVAIALEEGVRSGIRGKVPEVGDFSAFAVGCNLAQLAWQLIREQEDKEDGSIRTAEQCQEGGSDAAD